MKRLLILVAALAAGAALAAVRPDAAQAQDTAAVAINTKDGSSIFRLAFAIKRAAGDVVDSTNAAVAIASCSECQTTAISIQVVLVTGDPEVANPQNIALAYNVLCTACDTLASAYQWALSTDGQVHFTAEGNQAVAEIRRQLRELGRSDVSGAEIQARLDELMQRLNRVLEQELVAAGKSRSSGESGSPAESERSPPADTSTEQTETTPTVTEPAEPPTTTTTPAETGTTTTTTP
jgi:putative peptide zinc metalloprotease protein